MVRRNAFSGISVLAKYDAQQAGTVPRCGALVQRAERGANTTDLVAEHQRYSCPAGMLWGGTDIAGCSHCAVRES